MGKWGIPGYCSTVPNCCGLSLRSGTLWIAEACSIVGLGLVVLSSVTIDSIHFYFGKNVSYYWTEFFYIPIGFGVFQLATSLLLVYGVLTERQLPFIPWLVFHTLQTMLIFLGSIGVAILLSMQIIPLPFSYLAFLSGVAYSEFFRHLIIVVLSHCLELKRGLRDGIDPVV